jgi:hypothetical protein
VLSGRGLCDELITRLEESYRLWCVIVCDLENSWMRRPRPTGGCRAKKQKNKLSSESCNRNVSLWIIIERLHSAGTGLEARQGSFLSIIIFFVSTWIRVEVLSDLTRNPFVCVSSSCQLEFFGYPHWGFSVLFPQL